MRITLFVALIAVGGASGLAVALDVPVAPVGVPVLPSAPEAVLVLEPAEAAEPVVDAVAGPAAPVVEAVRAAAAAANDAERLFGIPRHLLLSDGSLVATMHPLTGEASLEQGIVLRSTPTRAMQDAAAAPLPGAALRRFESPGDLRASDSGSASAPGPVATQDARVFQPPAPRGGADPTIMWGGGLALGAAALAGLALYHRIRPNAALENETRKVIFDAVCAQPGLGVHEISKTAGVSYSTATYHLERLIGAGMIVMTPDGNKLCYYKNGGAFSESERRILPILKNEEAAKLFEAILEAPGTYRAALADKLGVTATTINWHLRRLREAGLVDETRAGRSAHLYARVDALRPTFLTLASKVEPSEPSVAAKLRRYASPPPGETTGVGAA